MKLNPVLLLIFSICLFAGNSCIPMKTIQPIPSSTQQLLLVITDSFSSDHGRMYCFEKKNTEKWIFNNVQTNVMVGRNGLAVGRGIHPAEDLNDMPMKKEGDGKSPAGIFVLSKVFGFSATSPVEGLKMTYIPVTEMTECVDDISSTHYNQIVTANGLDIKDWKSSEKMNEMKQFYELGVVVDHNQQPVVNGCGSCIFLHIWSDPVIPTSGCTSMALSEMKKIAGWLDIHKSPVLVQLPLVKYQQLKKKWQLPELP